MSIATAIENAQAKIASAYSACNEKGATMPTLANQNLSNLADTIATISGGGSQGFTKAITTDDKGDNVQTFVFSGLEGEPKAFIMTYGGSYYGVLCVVGDSTGYHGVYSAASTRQHNYTSDFTVSYSNGSLSVTAPSGTIFADGAYSLVYYYGSGTLTFRTSQVAPGSGVTSVTFTGTGMTETPAMYACMLETQVNNESYRRVALYTNCFYGYDGNDDLVQEPLGLSFFSSSVSDTTSSFSVSYNNGLYINSGGTNAGGYFHNPGTYTLYYLMASDIGGEPGPNLQNKTVTPSTSQQSVTADSGYDGLGTVTVSAIQTETKTATPSTSQQTINATSGKYMTSVTVSAVTSSIDADIVAGNIKSGVNILGVTGTYEGSGGGATLTPTAGDYPVVGNGGLGGGGNSLTSTGISVTIPVSGTYRLKWCAFRRANSTGYTWSSRLYRTRSGSTTAIGTENSTWTSTYIQTNSLDIACNAGDVITVYVAGRSNSYSWGGMLTACVAQKLWTN